MWRFCLQLIIIAVALFTFLTITMTTLGSTQPVHPALQGFVQGCEGVSRPCWYGIVPLETIPYHAEMTLMLRGFKFQKIDQFWYWRRDDWGDVSLHVNQLNFQVSGLTIYPLELLTVEDVFSVLPTVPTHVGRNCQNGYHLYMGLEIMGTDGTTPDSLVTSIQLTSFPLGSALLNNPYSHWRGFWHEYPITGGLGCG